MQVGLGMKGQAKNTAIMNLLKGNATVDLNAVTDVLKFEQASRSIEGVTVVDTDAKVVASVGGPSRRGQTLDPDGIVSLLKANLTQGQGQIKKSGIVT